jgi:hypothetical protein
MASLSPRAPRAAGDPVTFRTANPDDASGVRRLLRETPFGRRISLTLEADPTHRHDLADPHRTHVVVAARPTAPRTVLGLAERSVHDIWLDGRPARIGYLGQLRRKPGEEITLRRLREGFRLLEEHRLPDELPFDFTSILADNASARRLLERVLPGLPRYEPAGTVLTLTFAASRVARSPSGEIRVLQQDDRDKALACLQRSLRCRQLAPRLSLAVFDLPGTHWFLAHRDGRITGCIALWDQRSFKSITIHDYAPWLRRLRFPVNLARRLTGSTPLPPIGSRLPLAFLSFLAADSQDPKVLVSLVAAAACAARQHALEFLSIGLPEGHAALPSLRRMLRPEVTPSIIYLVRPPHRTRQMTSPLETPLPIHPEIALL